MPLGTVWSYNNAGFYVAGRVVEVLTGMPFEAALRELVLEPLGLRRSFFFADEVITHRFAVGHDRTGAVSRYWSVGRTAAPTGGLVTSVRELLAYARVQWEPGSFLAHASLAAMRRPQVSGAGQAMGLGWFVSSRDGHCLMSHTGANCGQQSLLIVAPDDQFALAVRTNHDDGAAVYKAIRAEVLRVELGLYALEHDPLDRSDEQLAEYVGEYRSAVTVARLSVADGGLQLASGGCGRDEIPRGFGAV